MNRKFEIDGGRIRAIREAREETQQAFANRLKVEVSSVRRWENGKTVPQGRYVRDRLIAWDRALKRLEDRSQ